MIPSCVTWLWHNPPGLFGFTFLIFYNICVILTLLSLMCEECTKVEAGLVEHVDIWLTNVFSPWDNHGTRWYLAIKAGGVQSSWVQKVRAVAKSGSSTLLWLKSAFSWKGCGCGRKGGHHGLWVSSGPGALQNPARVHLRAQVDFKFAVRSMKKQINQIANNALYEPQKLSLEKLL